MKLEIKWEDEKLIIRDINGTIEYDRCENEYDIIEFIKDYFEIE